MLEKQNHVLSYIFIGLNIFSEKNTTFAFTLVSLTKETKVFLWYSSSKFDARFISRSCPSNVQLNWFVLKKPNFLVKQYWDWQLEKRFEALRQSNHITWARHQCQPPCPWVSPRICQTTHRTSRQPWTFHHTYEWFEEEWDQEYGWVDHQWVLPHPWLLRSSLQFVYSHSEFLSF